MTKVGLQYIPVTFNSLPKPVWILRDDDGLVWVDLKSVIQTLGMSWHRWQLVIKLKRAAWRLEGCMDRDGHETELIAETNFVRWLAEIQDITKGYPARTSLRAQGLRSAWRLHYEQVAEETFPDLIQADAVGDPGRKRKVTAETVIRLHHELRVVGKSIARAADSLQISQTSVKLIAAGRYKNWTRDAQEAWRTTFGAD